MSATGGGEKATRCISECWQMPECSVCHRPKPPRGRSVAAETARRHVEVVEAAAYDAIARLRAAPATIGRTRSAMTPASSATGGAEPRRWTLHVDANHPDDGNEWLCIPECRYAPGRHVEVVEAAAYDAEYMRAERLAAKLAETERGCEYWEDLAYEAGERIAEAEAQRNEWCRLEGEARSKIARLTRELKLDATASDLEIARLTGELEEAERENAVAWQKGYDAGISVGNTRYPPLSQLRLQAENAALREVVEAARLKRNTLLIDTDGLIGHWVAVPECDFDRLRDALAALEEKP